MNTMRIPDLTVEELLTRLRSEIRNAVREAGQEAMTESQSAHQEQLILDIPTLEVGPWPTGLTVFSREEMYDDFSKLEPIS